MLFSSMEYYERLSYLTNEDFLLSCETSGEIPSEVLGLSQMTRAEKCLRPVVIVAKEFSATTGEWLNSSSNLPESMTVACMSSNPDKCPSCADFMRRLRVRQILDGMAETHSALFTHTAPSFGRVHNANWTYKDVYKYRNFSDEDLYHARLTVQRSRPKCPCGKSHSDDEGIVGTPLNAKKYKYEQETIWVENLPRLIAATTRKVKRLAAALGIPTGGLDENGEPLPNALHLYWVFERQTRGSYHEHMLISVDGDSEALVRLVDSIKKNWVSPIARIPHEILNWYSSSDLEMRIHDSEITFNYSIKTAVPKAKWKGGGPIPATQWGKQFDIRMLNDSDENGEEITNHKQLANYLATYLQKHQTDFSAVSLSRVSPQLRKHYLRSKQTAIIILADKVIYNHRLATLNRLRKDTIPETPEREEAITKRDDFRDIGITASPIASALIPRLMRFDIPLEHITDVIISLIKETDEYSDVLSGTSEYDEHFLEFSDLRSGGRRSVAYIRPRGLRTVLNRLGLAGGFTASVNGSSKWRSLTSYRKEIADWAKARSDSVPRDPSLFVYSLDYQRMEEARVRRDPKQYSPDGT